MHMKIRDDRFNPETCPALCDQDNLMLDALFDYAEMHKGNTTTLEHFCELAYERFSPKDIYAYLSWHKQYQEDDEQRMIIRILDKVTMG